MGTTVLAGPELQRSARYTLVTSPSSSSSLVVFTTSVSSAVVGVVKAVVVTAAEADWMLCLVALGLLMGGAWLLMGGA